MRSPVATLLCCSILATCACGQQPGSRKAITPAGSTPASATPSVTPDAVPTNATFVVVMENRAYNTVLGAPFTASLISKHALATRYRAVSHPSLPNYLAMTSGSTWGITDDGWHPLPSGQDVGSQLTEAGIPWRAYMEGMTRGCLDSPYPYALKHNPFAYYGGRCPSQVQPLDRMDADLSSTQPPRFVFITPDMCHDGHDCSTAEGDRFLQSLFERISGSPAWRRGALLLITWDEDDGSANNQVALIAVNPQGTPRRFDSPLDHYSLLALIEDRLKLPRLGAAAQATAIPDPTIAT